MVEVPGYRIVRELAHGGMAAVYLAEQCSLGRQVALKVLDREAGAARDLRRRFLREGRVAAGLHHRHIVAVHDVGECDGIAYIAMEYLPLGAVTALCGRIAPDQALRCIAEIGLALDHAHARGIVHRDVKPGNILRHEDGAFMLGDFGIAHVAAASTVLTRQGQTAGTPAYMAPELWRDGPVGAPVDFYALGCVLHHLLTGRPPYGGTDGWAVGMQHMNAPLPRLPAECRSLQGLLARLLAKDPAERVASGAALGEHIAALRRDGRVPGGPAASTPPATLDAGGAGRHEWPFLGQGPTEPLTDPPPREPAGEVLPAARRLSGLPGAWRGAAFVLLLLAAAGAALLSGLQPDPAPVADASDDAFGAYQRGLRLLEQGSGAAQADEALRWFQQALDRDPGLARAHVGACRTHVRQFEFGRDTAALERAAAACEQAARLDPALPELALAQGQLARSAGDDATAERHYTRALDHPLTRVEAHLRLSQLAAARADPEGALAHLDAARTADKGNWRVHQARGNFHYSQGQLREAAQAYREAAALAPDDVASPWNNLGAVHLTLHDFPRASEALYRSITIEPSHGALSNLGTVRFYLGDFAESAALFRRAVALAPSDYRGWGNLGDAASQLPGGDEEAQRSYRRAAEEAERQLAVNPGDGEVRGALAWYRANLGEPARARSLLAEAVQALGADALALRAAQVQARLGDLGAARASVARALAGGTPPQLLAALPVLSPVLAGMDTAVLAGDPEPGVADGADD